MKHTVLKRFGFIVFVALIAVLFSLPASTFGADSWLGQRMAGWQISLGLDLKGGTELDYKIDLSAAIAQNEDDDLTNDVDLNRIAESVRDALEARVNPNGVGEVVVKRSQVDMEEHVLIQLPPGSNVEEAKASAEKDNRLTFYEETPEKEVQTRLAISAQKQETTAGNWEAVKEQLSIDPLVDSFSVEGKFQDQIVDQSLAEKLFAAQPGQILEGVIETNTEVQYEFVDGQIQVTEFPRSVIGMVLVTDKASEEREVTNQPEAMARHILIGYEGALRAPEDVPYKSAEEAKAKAQEILDQLKAEGTTDFPNIAKEFSTEEAAATSGGDLGTFGPDSNFVPEFKNPIFGMDASLVNQPNYTEGFKAVGLLPELVETGFGYHIIEVVDYTPESREVVSEDTVSYEMIAWDKDELRWTETLLGGNQLENAIAGHDQIGKPLVNILFNDEGADLFAKLTKKLASKECPDLYAVPGVQSELGPCRLGIKVGENFISTPTVTEPLYGNQASITGSTTFEEARQLADDLNLGAIDAPVTLVGDITIKAELGEEQLKESLYAGAMGLLFTMILMVVLYRWAGVVASVALLLYAGLYIMILKVWGPFFGAPIVVSLSGVAGIALSIGLAVDANILIFERLKEELHEHKRNIHQAVDLGFERAWSAIKDTNLTTLLTCVILYTIGSSVVKGFAITLIVGTILSLFTAITISRTLLRMGLMNSFLHKEWMYGHTPARFKKKKSETPKSK